MLFFKLAWLVARKRKSAWVSSSLGLPLSSRSGSTDNILYGLIRRSGWQCRVSVVFEAMSDAHRGLLKHIRYLRVLQHLWILKQKLDHGLEAPTTRYLHAAII